MKIRALRPEQGNWIGNDIIFNVSSDGEKISQVNSNLKHLSSVIISVQTNAYRETHYIYETIRIREDGSFDFKKTNKYLQSGNLLRIVGKFTSSSEASGTFTFTNYGQDKLNGSTTWKAYPVK